MLLLVFQLYETQLRDLKITLHHQNYFGIIIINDEKSVGKHIGFS